MKSRSRSYLKALKYFNENYAELSQKYYGNFVQICEDKIVNVSLHMRNSLLSCFGQSWTFLILSQIEAKTIKDNAELTFWRCICEPYRKHKESDDAIIADRWLYLNGYTEFKILMLRILVYTSLIWHAYDDDDYIHRIDVVVGWFILPSLLLSIFFFGSWITYGFWYSLRLTAFPMILMAVLFFIVDYCLRRIEMKNRR